MKWVFLFIFIFSNMASADHCQLFLAHSINPINSQSNTDQLIAYLTKLIDEQVVPADYLNVLIKNLENHQSLPNPFSGIHTKSEQLIHQDSMQEYLEQNNFDHGQLLQWANQLLESKQLARQSRVKTENETKAPYVPMIFHEIRPGVYEKGEEKVRTEIDKPFSMMQTLVTQYMWVSLRQASVKYIPIGGRYLQLNPSAVFEESELQSIVINEKSVKIPPDHPVTNVDWESGQDFINGLNLLSQDPDPKVQKLLTKIIPDHKMGDRFDLPTDEQWEFVMRNRGQVDGEYFDQPDARDLTQYAWYHENSRGHPHRVAELKPRMIDGHPFYDLEGNLFEWLKNENLRGGCWDYAERFMRSKKATEHFEKLKYSCIGLRLVRYRP